MATPHRYERKVRITLWVAVALLLAAPALALRSCMSSLQSDGPAASAHEPDEDRLVELRNGATMLLNRGPLSAKVVEWLERDNDRTAFGIADSNFSSRSADPTLEGLANFAQVAQILNADPQLRAHVIVAAIPAEDPAALALNQSRARRVLSELFRQGVPAARISVMADANPGLGAEHVIDHLGQDSRLFIMLSR